MHFQIYISFNLPLPLVLYLFLRLSSEIYFFEVAKNEMP